MAEKAGKESQEGQGQDRRLLTQGASCAVQRHPRPPESVRRHGIPETDAAGPGQRAGDGTVPAGDAARLVDVAAKMDRRAKQPQFRRSRHLVGFWRGRWFFFHNYATGREAIVPSSTASTLDFFDAWRTAGAFATHAKISRAEARNAIAMLLRDGVLESSHDSGRRRAAALDRWGSWNPSAGFFHSATRDAYYEDPLEGSRQLREQARTMPVPAAVKRYPGAHAQSLPRVQAVGDFPSVLLERRTWRQFSKQPLSIEAVSTLLGLTGGIHHWATIKGQPDLPLKTSPSGGSRHPIEIYLWARRIEGLASGLYHYRGDVHRLELLKAQRRPGTVERYLPTQFWYNDAPALAFFSAVYSRYQWKYTDPRAYRATLVEVGHQCQTFCLTATWLGLAPFCSMALADSEIESDLGLDGVSESVLYAAGVGLRPTGTAVRATPKGFSPARVRANRRLAFDR